jgi:phosphoribosylanthranilate isomerase
MKAVKLKVCGMKYNTAEVASLRPDYLGFIFYEKSPRFFEGKIPSLPPGIKKVGVFVNAGVEEISEKIKTYKLNVIQLHGEESPEYCKKLSEHCQSEFVEVEVPALSEVEVWKVFSIKDSFDFSLLKPYDAVVDAFLFDTKGKDKGGNGYTFNWELLKEYSSKKPFVLSGGIGLDEIDALKNILKTNLPVFAIDVNSRFEEKPGLKKVSDLKIFKEQLMEFRV